jgi:primosomal protein N' (replication factor Y)
MPALFPTEAAVGYARVAVERGIDRYPEGLTYAVPADLAGLAPGERVVVPLGRGDATTAGYVIEVRTDCDLDADDVKLIRRRDETAPRLPADLLDLATWMSRYYCAPIGITLAAMLPAAVKRGVGSVTRTLIDLAEPTEPAPDAPPARLTPKQRAVLDVMETLPPAERPVEIQVLADRSGLRTTGPIKRLVERGRLAAIRRTRVEAEWAEHADDAPPPDTLTTAQQRVVDAIGRGLGGGFSRHLLFGVTGAGKTEVYIRLIQRVVARGGVAIVLVPEISLTPQTGGRLVGRFPRQRVAILHSGLTAAQRHQQWALVATGAASIVLGPRSAVFAPVPPGRLGLVIVDEEHDGSYKQDRTPRYHGRDVAIRRADQAACPIVLGSATPSLESWRAATERRSTLHELDQRAPGLRLPRVQVVDFAAERRARPDRRVRLLGPTLETALERTLAAGRQALLLLNRRGYANYIACPDQGCGWVMTCDDCDVSVVYHKSGDLPYGGFVQCHHCLAEQRLPGVCPDCGRRVTVFGLGTQRVEEELTRSFPALAARDAMRRVDSDSIRSSRELHEVLARFGAGVTRVLIGTQMIAKGLDYPGVGLVGVINADTALNLPDFRATERTFQLVSQVAGRCGRSSTAGGDLVVVQSFNPDTPAIRLAAAHDYRGFAKRELAERQGCGLPPFTRMARVVIRDPDHVRAVNVAEAVALGLRSLAGATVRVRGPAPCPIARIAAHHRQQVEVLAPSPGTLQQLLATARNRRIIEPGAMMAVDVDPIALL